METTEVGVLAVSLSANNIIKTISYVTRTTIHTTNSKSLNDATWQFLRPGSRLSATTKRTTPRVNSAACLLSVGAQAAPPATPLRR